MQGDYEQQILGIQREIDQALKKLRNRQREKLTPQQVKALRNRLSALYEKLQDTKFMADQPRIFRKRAFTARSV